MDRPICINCHYHEPSDGTRLASRYAKCTRNRREIVDVVTGEVELVGDVFCLDERKGDGGVFKPKRCGIKGRFFHHKDYLPPLEAKP